MRLISLQSGSNGNFATTKTYRAARRYNLGEIEDLRHFTAGETLRFG